MVRSGRALAPVPRGLIITAWVLLMGVLALALGYDSGNRIAFWAGVSVTLAGVLSGIQRLIAHDSHGRTGPGALRRRM